MKCRLYTLAASSACPFSVEALQYIPERSYCDGLTLIFMHAVNTHKETYEALLTCLFRDIADSEGLRIRDAWCIDSPNCGRSAALNRDSLGTTWTGNEYAQSVHAFLTTTTHGVDFRSRQLVAAAHSAGAVSLISMLKLAPQVRFRSLILLDPGILPMDKGSAQMVIDRFKQMAASKRDTWPSREAAYDYMSSHLAYRSWDSEVLRLFVRNALRPTDRNDGSVTLSLSKELEMAWFRKANFILPDVEFRELCAEGDIPVHLMLNRIDEFRGILKETQEYLSAHTMKTPGGSVRWIEKGGHMFVQTAPKEIARAIAQVLAPASRGLREPVDQRVAARL